jgi:formylglycine-generating enzyme required for sulfatase activity
MNRWKFWLLCVGKAVRGNGLKLLTAMMLPMGETLYEIAKAAWTELRKKQTEEEIRLGLGDLAAAPDTDIECEAQKVALEVAGDQSTDVQLQLVTYLRQLPNTVRASLSRPADPSGRTLPGNFRLDQPEGLIPLLPDRLPRFRPGDRPSGIGDWELIRLLGTGGFGEVWLARNPVLPTPVALKFCLDAKAAQYLRHEAALLGRVVSHGKHPGIVALQHTYLSADPPCLEYEYVAGGHLMALISQWHARSTPDLVQHSIQLVRELADIVAFAHRLHPPIVHRDLKPANILLQRTPDGQVRLRVTDFGIGGVAVEKARDQKKSGSLSNADLMVTSLRGSHTLLYASPEQMRGDLPDPRDDVHALGVIWLQLLTGDLNRGVTGDWRDELSDRKVPEPVIAVLRRCVTSTLERRFSTAGDLVLELDKLLGAAPTAPPPAAPMPLPAMPPPAAPTATPTPPATQAPAAAATASQSQTQTQASPPVPITASVPPPRRGGRWVWPVVVLALLGVTWIYWPLIEPWLPGPAAGSEPITNSIGMKLVPIPAGRFSMGTAVAESFHQKDEDPLHQVVITKPFFMGAHEVTQRQYEKVMRSNPSVFKNGARTLDHPVENVTYRDALDFCRALSALPGEASEGRVYTLPTEAQWEYACRGGQSGRRFAFGNTLGAGQANFDTEQPFGDAAAGKPLKKTSAVGQYDPNAWGLYDMHGNVAEWCLDFYAPAYPGTGAWVKDPVKLDKGDRRVVRGGSWSSSGAACRSGARQSQRPEQTDDSIGFRVVMTIRPSH